MDQSQRKHITNAIVEKLLVNLRVISSLKIGEKIEVTAENNFIPQTPSLLTSAWRFVKGTNRWSVFTKVQDCVASAEVMESHDSGIEKDRIRKALVMAVHGLRNWQLTYSDDTLFFQSIEVLIERIAQRCDLSSSDTF
jgi:hypothetical protein